MKDSDCPATAAIDTIVAASALIANSSKKRALRIFSCAHSFSCRWLASINVQANVGELLIRNECGITPVHNRKSFLFILLAQHRGFADAINGFG